ncbi:MAG: peptidoglycan DD-metalloendopeptidase family protein [Stomatobaculum sp.]|nr:peptidoglycan DD-metalloendopeptidase family protein [Stomatobaculum sp.]
MRKIQKACFVLAVFLGFASIPARYSEPVYAAATKEEKQKLDAAAEAKKKLQEEKKRTQNMISELNTLKNDVTVYLEKLDKNLETIEGEIERLNGEIVEKEEQLDVTKGELKEAEETADKQFDDMKLRIKYMYEKGETGFLDLLLTSGNLADFFNRAEYVDKISSYDRAQLDVYEAAVETIEVKRSELEEEKAELQVLQQDETAKQESVKALMSEKRTELAKYKSQISDAQSEISAYDSQLAAQEEQIRSIEATIKKREEEERKRAEEEARRKREAEAAAKAASQKQAAAKDLGSIHFIWPCPASGRITSPFGKRSSPTKGASTYHNGVDIGAATGTNIVAAASGEVVSAGYSGASGNMIMISHGGGIYTLYMHCSKINCSEGQTVKAGQTIGKVGSTGVSTGPHLHFAIRSGGSYLNPLKYVSP